MVDLGKDQGAELIRTAREFGDVLEKRNLPGLQLLKKSKAVPSETSGWYLNVASIRHRPGIWGWYDKYVDGLSLRLWFGFGCDNGGDHLLKMLDEMSDPPQIGKHLYSLEEDSVSEPFLHLRNPLPVDVLSQPVLETYPRGYSSAFGLYQIEDTSKFIIRAADFVEQVLRGLPETMNSEALTLEELREKALAAAIAGPEATAGASRTIYQRSAAVKAYVLARANGVCEACGDQAPFKRKDGKHYLEPHHTDMLADGGPDHPDHVAAICPNCHREIHYGENGKSLNDRARAGIRQSRR